MRQLRTLTALLTMAAIIAACSGPPGSSSGGESQGSEPSTGSQPSQAAASSGGGGGGGANGSLQYEITGDVTKSGDLAFTYIAGGVSMFTNGGWVAYFYSEDEQTIVQINSNPQSNIVLFGDGQIVVTGTSETGCNFDYSQNDASGLKGTIDCTNVIAANTTGAQINVDFHATMDAHT